MVNTFYKRQISFYYLSQLIIKPALIQPLRYFRRYQLNQVLISFFFTNVRSCLKRIFLLSKTYLGQYITSKMKIASLAHQIKLNPLPSYSILKWHFESLCFSNYKGIPIMFFLSNNSVVPRYSFLRIEVKDFYYSNNFCYMVVQVSVIALYMHKFGCNTIRLFEMWLLKNNWPKLLKFITDLLLE